MTVASTMSYLQSNLDIEGYVPKIMNRCRGTKEPFPAPCWPQLFLAVSSVLFVSFVGSFMETESNILMVTPFVALQAFKDCKCY